MLRASQNWRMIINMLVPKKMDNDHFSRWFFVSESWNYCPFLKLLWFFFIPKSVKSPITNGKPPKGVRTNSRFERLLNRPFEQAGGCNVKIMGEPFKKIKTWRSFSRVSTWSTSLISSMMVIDWLQWVRRFEVVRGLDEAKKWSCLDE